MPCSLTRTTPPLRPAGHYGRGGVYGTPTVKRIYGDWTTPNMASWKPLLLEHAITPIQQYSYTTGKNATDSAMIIDAMDLLYSGRCDGFVLVSKRQRLHPPGHPAAGGGDEGVRHGGEKDPPALYRGLRQIHLHRGHPGRRGKSPAGGAGGVRSGARARPGTGAGQSGSASQAPGQKATKKKAASAQSAPPSRRRSPGSPGRWWISSPTPWRASPTRTATASWASWAICC